MCSINNKLPLCKNDDCDICFNKSFASSLYVSWWNDSTNPRYVYKRVKNKYNFICRKCSHTLISSVCDIDRGRCSYCSNMLLCDNDCNLCYDKSFQTSEFSKYWSTQNEKTPRQIFKVTGKKYKFDCPKCLHTFDKMISNIRTHLGCPYCVGQKLCSNENCSMCFELSLANTDKGIYFSTKNNISARNVFSNCTKPYLFNCNDCNNEIIVSPNRIIQGSWCFHCAHIKICNNDNCVKCFDKSFASSPKVSWWSPNNIKTPREVSRGTSDYYLFKCPECSLEFKTSPSNLKGCPYCVNKTEKLFYEYLVANNYKVDKEVRFDWCKNIRYLPFDFVIDNNIIVELDGGQHFKQVMDWKTPEENVKTDVHKMVCAYNKNYSIIRIPQEWVYYNTNNWEDYFVKSMELCRENKLIIFPLDYLYSSHEKQLKDVNIEVKYL